MAASKNYTPTARIDLDVTFKTKSVAKKLGAKWDPNRKVWFTYAGDHRAPFMRRFMSDEAEAVLDAHLAEVEAKAAGTEEVLQA